MTILDNRTSPDLYPMALLGRLQKVEQSRLHVTANASPTMNNKITTYILRRHKDSEFL